MCNNSHKITETFEFAVLAGIRYKVIPPSTTNSAPVINLPLHHTDRPPPAAAYPKAFSRYPLGIIAALARYSAFISRSQPGINPWVTARYKRTGYHRVDLVITPAYERRIPDWACTGTCRVLTWPANGGITHPLA